MVYTFLIIKIRILKNNNFDIVILIKSSFWTSIIRLTPLFSNLQKVNAELIGMNPILALAANSSGGVTGKMISPQSIAASCAAVGLVGKESELFRFTIKHSMFLVVMIGIIVWLLNTVLTFMIP